MKGIVAYHTKWGNCGQIAESVAAGLQEAGHEVSLVNVKKAHEIDPSLEFLVAGSGTRAGRMTGPMRRFLERNVGEDWRGKPFAAFGTGAKSAEGRQDPKGADGIFDLLRERGLTPLAPAHKATVTGMRGPLAEGETERARAFGVSVGEALKRRS